MELVPILTIIILSLAMAGGLTSHALKGKGMNFISNAIGRNAKRHRSVAIISAVFAFLAFHASSAFGQTETHQPGGEANLKLPDLGQVKFLGVDGHTLLLVGIVICVFGLLFGLAIYTQLKKMPVHKSMREISELIYETCKTYLVTQGKFILILEAFIAVIIV